MRRGELVGDAAWPPLVSEETFYACQRRLADQKLRGGRSFKPRWLLSGVARCGTCGAFLRCVPNHNHRIIYQCRSLGGDLSKGRYCTSIVADAFEAYVTEKVIDRLSRDDARGMFTADRSAEAAEAAAALLRKKQELDELHTLVDQGELTLQSLARHEPRITAEIAALEEQARSHVAPVVRDVVGPDAAARWEQLSLAQRKELLLNVADIRLHKTSSNRGRIDARHATRTEQVKERVTITWKTA